MPDNLSRRDFLKISGLGVVSSILPPALYPVPPEDSSRPRPVGQARVSTTAIYRYSEPDFESERNGTIRRDVILPILKEIRSPAGPKHNPLWYEIAEGYVHSGYLQRVDAAAFSSQSLKTISKKGRLGRICVPYSDSLRLTYSGSWQPLYRLYYQSVYWITGLEEGPDGDPWYRLTDDLLHVHYYIPTTHIDPIQSEELKPVSPQIPPEEKRIEISLSDQTLTAFEFDREVLHTRVSTGIPSNGPSPNGIPTDTPPGRFRIGTKMPTRHMGDGELTSDIEAYELPGVPWVCFFHIDGLALHGTYWHNNFGRRMSHGCVNLKNDDALWLYRWTSPVASPRDWFCRGSGTVLDILE